MTLPLLPIERLNERHSGISQGLALAFHEAIRICLDRHHTSPVSFNVDDAANSTATELRWPPTNPELVNAWANDIDTTEAGAYGVCIAAVELFRNLFAVRRAETGTGADYYLAPQGGGEFDLEDCIRLEVSGTDSGSATEVRARLLAKVAQTRRGACNLPAVASVVGFFVRRIALSEVVTK